MFKNKQGLKMTRPHTHVLMFLKEDLCHQCKNTGEKLYCEDM